MPKTRKALKYKF